MFSSLRISRTTSPTGRIASSSGVSSPSSLAGFPKMVTRCFRYRGSGHRSPVSQRRTVFAVSPVSVSPLPRMDRRIRSQSSSYDQPRCRRSQASCRFGG